MTHTIHSVTQRQVHGDSETHTRDWVTRYWLKKLELGDSENITVTIFSEKTITIFNVSCTTHDTLALFQVLCQKY